MTAPNFIVAVARPALDMTRLKHCTGGPLAADGDQQQLQLRTEGLDDASLLQLGARWRALTADAHAADAVLSPEAALLAERQACLHDLLYL